MPLAYPYRRAHVTSRAFAHLGLLALTLPVLAPPAYAQWKWISPSGVVQYSDQPPPPSIPPRHILAKALALGPAAAPAASSASAADGQLAEQKTAAARELQQKLAQEKNAQEAAQRLQQQVDTQMRQSNCVQAQRQLQIIGSQRHIAVGDGRGAPTYLDAGQLAAQREQIMAQIASYCR